LLDIGAFPKDNLARRANLLALLFGLEQRHPPQELEQLLGEVIDWFRKHEDFEQLRGLFCELVREAVAGVWSEALLWLLVERFGAVAPSWRKRIRGADQTDIEHRFKRATVAPDVSSVFAPPG
jgi:hypothetical protein